MRNILTVLMLCFITLTTSSVFAEKFDESKRTERFGLSFYDGAPMYYLYVGRPGDSSASGESYPVGSLYLYAERLRTGDNIADLPKYSDRSGYVVMYSADHCDFIIYGYDKDGKLEYLSQTGAPDESIWMQDALKTYGPTVIAQARLRDGDLAVETYDEIAPEAQAWARRGILLAVALLVISAGLNKFRELTSGGASTSETDAKTGPSPATVQESREERATMRKIREAAMMGNLGGGLDERFLSESERREHDFITGAAFGLSFDDKVRASNKLFLEAFNRLSDYDQEALLQEWRVSSYTKSYQDSIERRFVDWREGSPFNEEDGEPPF